MKKKKPPKFIYIVHQLDMDDCYDFWAWPSKKKAKEFKEDYMAGTGLNQKEVKISKFKFVETK